MNIHPECKLCSYLGRVLVLVDPAAQAAEEAAVAAAMAGPEFLPEVGPAALLDIACHVIPRMLHPRFLELNGSLMISARP